MARPASLIWAARLTAFVWVCCESPAVPYTVSDMTVTRSRLAYAAIMTTALAIGALQMLRVRGGVITDYGADVFGTAWLYAMFRQGRTIFQRGSTMSAQTCGHRRVCRMRGL